MAYGSDYNRQILAFINAFASAGETGLSQYELFNRAGDLGKYPRHTEVVIKLWSKLGHIEKVSDTRWRLTKNGKMFFANFREVHFSRQEQAA